jgi:hypothetical protein
MNRTSKESANQSYIRLINRVPDPSESPEARDTTLLCELIEDDCLRGEAIRNEQSVPVDAIVFGATVKGRLLAQSLAKQAKEAGIVHKCRGFFVLTVGYIAGLLSPILTDWLRMLLGVAGPD